MALFCIPLVRIQVPGSSVREIAYTLQQVALQHVRHRGKWESSQAAQYGIAIPLDHPRKALRRHWTRVASR